MPSDSPILFGLERGAHHSSPTALLGASVVHTERKHVKTCSVRVWPQRFKKWPPCVIICCQTNAGWTAHETREKWCVQQCTGAQSAQEDGTCKFGACLADVANGFHLANPQATGESWVQDKQSHFGITQSGGGYLFGSTFAVSRQIIPFSRYMYGTTDWTNRMG